MEVRMKVSVSGHRVESDGTSREWPPRGGVIDVSDAEGADLCRAGLAVPVADEPEAAVEESTDVETAAVKRPRGRTPRQAQE